MVKERITLPQKSRHHFSGIIEKYNIILISKLELVEAKECPTIPPLCLQASTSDEVRPIVYCRRRALGLQAPV